MKRSSKTTVILADDHTLFRSGLRSMLEQRSEIEVIAEAADGHATLQQVKQRSADILLLDISMPGLNGIDTLRQLRSEGNSVKTIVLSMHADRHFVQEAFRAGARGYMLKDSALDELVEGIRTVNNGSVYLSKSIAGVVIDDYVTLAESKNTDRDNLSDREREILQSIAEGKSTKEIAAQLCLSAKTVESHRKHIMDKLKLYSIAELTRYAIRIKLIPGE